MSRIFGKKSIVTIHGGELPLLKKFKFLRKIVVHSLNKSSLVIANSNFTKKELISLGVRNEKIIISKVPPNFLDCTSDKETLKDFRNKFTTPDTKIILFVGRLVERKGVEYAIRSLKEIKSLKIHLLIVGGGELIESLQNLTTSLGLNGKVTFFGRASNDELSLLYGISDIFVCPSITDSRGITEYLGLVIPEAMKFGLPVIASSVGGIVDTVKNEVNGLLVPPKNPKAISKAIERIIVDENLKRKIVENSKITVRDFSPKKIAQKHLEIFKSILIDESRP